MSINRKDFLWKVCVSGACMCGFSSLALAGDENNKPTQESKAPDEKQLLVQDWIASLLANIGSELDEESARKVIKKTAIVHYNNLKMDNMLADYVGNLEKFISFIEEKWSWKVDYNKTTKTLIADENKNYCVCPISQIRKDVSISAMCYCSEGFAEKMFSVVAGVPAKARVVSSIRRGDERCKYKIIFS